ncbi:hypothetical protein GMI70_02785 [Eggerthellaceae bacterium zg-893]|nr:hypothetical protein [Eggerthellaceae bacterium zg-893]
MGNSGLVGYTRISPMKTAMGGKKNKKITVHHMAGNLTVEQCGSVFQTREASANYGIGSDGRVGLYVDEGDRSWASSSSANDSQAVTIEVANSRTGGDWPVSDKAWAKLVELCADVCRRNGIGRLVWTGDASGSLTCHYMFAATACPGPYLKARMGRLAQEVNARLSSKAGWAKDAKGWWWREADGSYPKSAWKKVGGEWYRFGKDGYAIKGWAKVDGKWYYLRRNSDSEGPECSMATGWVKDGGKWYWLDGSGAMAESCAREIGGKTYAFGPSGAMIEGSVPVDGSGALVLD